MIKTRVCLLFFVLLLVVFATVTLGSTDPKLKECKHQCKVQQKLDERQRRACLQQECERFHQEKQQRERQEGRGEESNDRYQGREQEEQQGQQQEENPYVFQEQHFTTKIQTQHGTLRVLPRFTERSKLLKGIENYRLTILEAEPNTFIIPHHWDAEAVIFVVTGKGAVRLVREDKRESFNIRRGDIVRVPSGTTTYLVNSDNNNKLVIAKLLQPVFTPGRFESFFGAGDENPESYYRAFSQEILEAAFNTRRDRLQRIFGQQKQGVIIRASEEQIRALSQHKEEAQIWPFRGESKATFNIFEKRPSQSNQYGQLYEVDSDEYKRLEDLDVAISLANISRGGMTAPSYNSRATKISLVLNGDGYLEMACPHLSSQSQGRQGSQQEWGGSGRGSESQGRQGSQEEWGGSGRGSQRETRGGPRYQKVSARLRRGTVVIIPAGHPFVAVASNNQNLEIVCFEINANRNEKFPLAGKRNVFKQLEREAKELAFGVSAREVEEVFNSQQEEYFFKGPRQQQYQQEGRADALRSLSPLLLYSSLLILKKPMKRNRVGTEEELALMDRTKPEPPQNQTKVQERAVANNRVKFGEFLQSCHYCKKNLPEGVEIFMYRDFCGFCSIACRDVQIAIDQLAEKKAESCRVQRVPPDSYPSSTAPMTSRANFVMQATLTS
ncbi:hypothetical protein ACH5RR_010641 [Cinchona calisaya]|uniref:FLZ-type domain-containing protein n=1 Tax=Cinchona calisaya TaxID=153742 RepID=A0ABD3AJL6_9GENT